MKVNRKQLGLVQAAKRAPQDGPVEAFVPVKTTGQTSAHRGHWSTAARKVKREREATAWALVRHAPVRLPVVVTFTRCSTGELDDDNVRTACKGIRDEVTAWLGLANDRDPRARWEYAQEKVKRRTKTHAGGDVGVRVNVHTLDTPAEAKLRRDLMVDGDRRWKMGEQLLGQSFMDESADLLMDNDIVEQIIRAWRAA